MMSEQKNTNTEKMDAVQKDYISTFMPTVHRIGRVTMVLGLVLTFLPIVYFYFIKGYQIPLSKYIAIALTILSMEFGILVSEPLSYWPILGSAGTYMSYLSGNVGSLRRPVALQLQNAMNTPITTPRGQIVTIVGLGASVFSSLIMLLGVCLFGERLLLILPPVVLASFAYVIPALIGASWSLSFVYGKGILKEVLNNISYLIVMPILFFIQYKTYIFGDWDYAVVAIVCAVLAYIKYKLDSKKDTEASAEA